MTIARQLGHMTGLRLKQAAGSPVEAMNPVSAARRNQARKATHGGRFGPPGRQPTVGLPANMTAGTRPAAETPETRYQNWRPPSWKGTDEQWANDPRAPLPTGGGPGSKMIDYPNVNQTEYFSKEPWRQPGPDYRHKRPPRQSFAKPLAPHLRTGQNPQQVRPPTSTPSGTTPLPRRASRGEPTQ